jgi:hypothetical protein
MIQVYGPDLLRYKGVLWMKGNPRRVVFQGVHMMMGGDMGKPWARTRRSSRCWCSSARSCRKDSFIAGLEDARKTACSPTAAMLRRLRTFVLPLPARRRPAFALLGMHGHRLPRVPSAARPRQGETALPSAIALGLSAAAHRGEPRLLPLRKHRPSAIAMPPWARALAQPLLSSFPEGPPRSDAVLETLRGDHMHSHGVCAAAHWPRRMPAWSQDRELRQAESLQQRVDEERTLASPHPASDETHSTPLVR